MNTEEVFPPNIPIEYEKEKDFDKDSREESLVYMTYSELEKQHEETQKKCRFKPGEGSSTTKLSYD